MPRPPLPPRKSSWYSLLRVYPRAIMQPKGSCQWKIPMTTATVRLVAQYLNQPSHRIIFVRVCSTFLFTGTSDKVFRFRNNNHVVIRWSVPRSSRFIAGKEKRYPFYRRVGGPHSQSGRVWKISPSPGYDPRTIQLVTNRYTDFAIPVHVQW